jgi:hypothetical protein
MWNMYVDGEENVNEDVNVELVERGWCTPGVQIFFSYSQKYFFRTLLRLLLCYNDLFKTLHCPSGPYAEVQDVRLLAWHGESRSSVEN